MTEVRDGLPQGRLLRVRVAASQPEARRRLLEVRSEGESLEVPRLQDQQAEGRLFGINVAPQAISENALPALLRRRARGRGSMRPLQDGEDK